MKSQRFLVVAGLQLSESVMIGRNCLAKNDLIIDLRSKALHHYKNENDPSDYNYSLIKSENGAIYSFEEVPVTLTRSAELREGEIADVYCQIKTGFLQTPQPEEDRIGFKLNRKIICDYAASLVGGDELSSYMQDVTHEQEMSFPAAVTKSCPAGEEIGRAWVLYSISDAVDGLVERDERKRFSPTISEIDPPLQ